MARIVTTDEVNIVLTDIFQNISHKIDQTNLGTIFDTGNSSTKALCGTIAQAQLLGRSLSLPDFDQLAQL